jgi:hypothetical protein
MGTKIDTLSDSEEAQACIYREQKRIDQQANNLQVSWLQSLGEAKAAIGLLSTEHAIKICNDMRSSDEMLA